MESLQRIKNESHPFTLLVPPDTFSGYKSVTKVGNDAHLCCIHTLVIAIPQFFVIMSIIFAEESVEMSWQPRETSLFSPLTERARLRLCCHTLAFVISLCQLLVGGDVLTLDFFLKKRNYFYLRQEEVGAYLIRQVQSWGLRIPRIPRPGPLQGSLWNSLSYLSFQPVLKSFFIFSFQERLLLPPTTTQAIFHTCLYFITSTSNYAAEATGLGFRVISANRVHLGFFVS